MARTRSRFEKATYVKDNTNGDIFLVAGRYKNTLWLVPQDLTAPPFNAPDENYSPHTPQPKKNELWEGVDPELGDVKVLFMPTDADTGTDLIVYRETQVQAYGVLKLPAFVALYRKQL